MLLGASVLVAASGLAFGQTVSFTGSVPQTYSVLDTSNLAPAYVDSTFTAAIGQNTLTEATKVIRLRSNDVYALSAQVGSLSNIGTEVATAAGKTAAAIQIGDIGFGISALDATGGSVVKTGTTRTDTIVSIVATGPNFNYTTPTSLAGRVTFPATLYNISTAPTQLLSGDRISASGDDSSTDNFLAVSLKFGYLPQYFTIESAFSFVVTLTIAHT